jgi:hypothetical protein
MLVVNFIRVVKVKAGCAGVLLKKNQEKKSRPLLDVRFAYVVPKNW